MNQNNSVVFNFYGIDATLNANQALYKVLIKLLIKTQEIHKNSMIFSSSLDVLKELDDFLWTNSPWLPHALVTDKFKEKQPVLLTNELKNYNESQYLFIVDNSEFEILSNIDKISIIFNLNNLDHIGFFEKKWKYLQMSNFDLKYFRQDKQGKFQYAIP